MIFFFDGFVEANGIRPHCLNALYRLVVFCYTLPEHDVNYVAITMKERE